MYQNLFKSYQDSYRNVPINRNIPIGDAIKALRRQRGLTAKDLAGKSNLTLELIKSIEVRGNVNTSWTAFTSVAKAFEIQPVTLLNLAREMDDSLFFVLHKDHRPTIQFKGYKALFYTPSVCTLADFFLIKLIIEPACSTVAGFLKNEPVLGFVTDGEIAIQSKTNSKKIKANQSFTLQSNEEHTYLNTSNSMAAEVFLIISTVALSARHETLEPASNASDKLNMDAILDYVRSEMSPSPDIKLPSNIVSNLTGISPATLSHIAAGRTELVSFQKLEALSNLCGAPIETLLAIGQNNPITSIDVCNALHRGIIDYRDQFGISIYSASKIGDARKPFFMGQITFQKKEMNTKLRKKWHFRSQAMMALVVQDGSIFIECGEKRKEKLTRGDSIYLDASLDVLIQNLDHQDSKAYIFSNPPVF